MMSKLILINGLITVAGFLLDIYGVFDLTLYPALFGLILGIVDCVTFIWMREELRATFRRWRQGLKPYPLEDLLRDMETGDPQVMGIVIGQRMLRRVTYLAKQKGYEVADLSEDSGLTLNKYTLTLRRSNVK